MSLKDDIALLRRRFRKLRRDPISYFEDSRHPRIKTLGLQFYAASTTGIGFQRLSRLGDLVTRKRQTTIALKPLRGAERSGSAFRMSERGAQLFLSRKGQSLRGWHILSFRPEPAGTPSVRIRIWRDRRTAHTATVESRVSSAGRCFCLIRLPPETKYAAIDFGVTPDRWNMTSPRIASISAGAALDVAQSLVGGKLAQSLRLMETARRSSSSRNGASPERLPAFTSRLRMRRLAREMQSAPTFRIFLHIGAENVAHWRTAAASVQKQLYASWQLNIAPEASIAPKTWSQLRDLAATDRRIKLIEPGPSGSDMIEIDDASPKDWLGFLSPESVLTSHALYLFARRVTTDGECALVYGDHDHIDSKGRRYAPHYKPDWNYELFLGQNYLEPFYALRGDIAQAAAARAGAAGRDRFALLLHSIELLDARKIAHVPSITARRRRSRLPAVEAERCALQIGAHLARLGAEATTEPFETSFGSCRRLRFQCPDPRPLVSIVIPTRDSVEVLERCIRSVLETSTYPAMEAIVVDNGSVEHATHAYFDRLRADPRIRLLRVDEEFNFSRLCNLGVRSARGRYYVLLNNDTEVISPDWLEELIAHASRPGVGAVGAKLLYPNRLIQHAGVILGVGGYAGHSHRFFHCEDEGYFARLKLLQEYSAVTAACLAGAVDTYWHVGGLDEKQFPVALNDVDFCLRLKTEGYRVLWTPFAELYHHESYSRGTDGTGSRAVRLARERANFAERWAALINRDPAYHRSLTRSKEDFSVRSSGESPQYDTHREARLAQDSV